MDAIKISLNHIDRRYIKAIIVENNGLRHTCLDILECDVLYTNNNSVSSGHKGVNELLDIQAVINKYNIQDDDTIIKVTGRYKLLNNLFLNTVINNQFKYDVFVKFFNVCTLKYDWNDSVLGLFAIKSKYLKKFSYDCIKSPETEFALMVHKDISKEKIYSLYNLGLECNFAESMQTLIV